MSAREDHSALAPALAATLGLYETHRFCIRLSPDISLLDEVGRPKSTFDRVTLAVLTHEYIHYLHNLSTASSFAAFQAVQSLLAIFSHTLDVDGSCDPTKLTDEQEATALEEWSPLAVVQGACSIPRLPSQVTDIGVARARVAKVRVCEVEVEEGFVAWRLHRRDGDATDEELPIGSYMIEEGIAFTLEQCLRLGRMTFERSTEHPAPPYPYWAFQALVRYYRDDISALTAVRLGTLALCTNRPGAFLIHLLSDYQKRRSTGETDVEACVALRDRLLPIINDIMARILKTDLPEIRENHRERGLAAIGYEAVVREFEALLKRRAENPWFDLEWCSEDGTIDPARFSALINTSVPCDVIQEGKGFPDDFRRDTLLTSRPGGVAAGPDDVLPDLEGSGLRTVQAQMHYLLSHVGRDRRFVSSSDAANARGSKDPSCPYLSSCPHDMRRDDVSTCQKTPWKRRENNPTCWYGAAVSGTLGAVRLPILDSPGLAKEEVVTFLSHVSVSEMAEIVSALEAKWSVKATK